MLEPPEIEGVQGFELREAGGLDPAFALINLPLLKLTLEKGTQKLLITPTLLGGFPYEVRIVGHRREA